MISLLGASSEVKGEAMGVDGSGLDRAGVLVTPRDKRAAKRRDRNLSAICLGTSTDLIKLILAPFLCRDLVYVGSSGAGTSN